MSSRMSEVDHERQLRGLLETAGLECVGPPPPSTVTSSEDTTEPAEGIIEEQTETITENEDIEKEESVPDSLKPPEDHPEIEAVFPTPSLRRLIPERQRRIEEMNRMEVLPDEFPTSFDPESIPIIAQTRLVDVIDVLGNMTGCRRFKSNLAELWFLDTLADLLNRAQKDQMDTASETPEAGAQAVLMSWFCEWMKEVQYFDAADRQRMITRFQDNITAAAKFIDQNNRLPTPEEVGITYKSYTQELNKEESGDKTTDETRYGKLQTKKSDKGKKSKSDKKGKKGKGDKPKSPSEKIKVNKSPDRDGKSPKTDRESKDPSTRGDDEENKMGKKYQEKPENSECALVNLTNIAHYIYDLFSTDYQYELIRMIFTFPPGYIQVDSPYQMRVPKTLMPQSKKLTLDKEGTRTSLTKKERREDEYGKLLDLQEREERYLADREVRERAEGLRRSHILPLNAAVNNDSVRHLSAQTDNS